MRPSYWLPLLAMLFGIGGDVWAQDYSGSYRFRPRHGEPVGSAWSKEGEPALPWRSTVDDPGMNGSSGKSALQPIPQNDLYRSPVADYAQPPAGLPRGLYRPVEERHTITPHLEGYRFRPLRPDEQVRLKARSDKTLRAPEDDRQSDAMGYAESMPGGREARPVFRPDKRLEPDSRERYSLPSGPVMPRFRPQ